MHPAFLRSLFNNYSRTPEDYRVEMCIRDSPDLKIREVILSGGGANSKLWKQIVADIFNLPVKILAGAAEGGAYGGALVAGVGEGIYKNLDDAEKVHSVKEIVEPARCV